MESSEVIEKKLLGTYDPSEDIGERIKEIRTNAKKSQKDFASELGVSQSHISNIEKGTDKPSLTLIKFICTKFEVCEEWLTNNEGSTYTYDSWDLTDEGLYSKYIAFKQYSNLFMDKFTGEDRKYYVQTLFVLVGMLSCHDLDENEKHDFLKYIYGIIDNLEKMQFLISRYPNIHSIKKVNYKSLLECIEYTDSYINKINNNINQAMNIYFKKYNLPYKLKIVLYDD